ncbi:MAG TPA: iron-containing alcohol dehydrogenase [Bacteroidales bacterium]|nr:iron-containing alcohol dehydrogenase [Bacteroidales bacterium]HSA42191.1 iron-containing alcohol dehydrogenase [Bacteroidales bacterium]
MENFTAYNPTALHFGQDVIQDLGNTVQGYGQRVLLVYGMGSVKSSGVYQQVMAQLTKIKAQVYEYSGIRPNPLLEDVDAAAELGRVKSVDVILAVGGGSVIDTGKAIAVTIPVFHSAWDFFTGRAKPQRAIPLVAVLTLAATGSEMNQFAVIQNNRSKNKLGFGSPLMYPRHAFLDPSFTLSVPPDYTAYGIVDLISHAMESYFGKGDASLSDRIVWAIIREAMEYGPALMNDPANVDLRARIMLAATLALNGITNYGRLSGDWGVHAIGHLLSVLFDVPHGATLSIAYPAWLKVMKERQRERIVLLGKNLFGTDDPDSFIRQLESFFSMLGSPVRLSQIGLTAQQHIQIREHMSRTKATGRHLALTEEDYDHLLALMA